MAPPGPPRRLPVGGPAQFHSAGESNATQTRGGRRLDPIDFANFLRPWKGHMRHLVGTKDQIGSERRVRELSDPKGCMGRYLTVQE
jgi:hypothetical protein